MLLRSCRTLLSHSLIDGVVVVLAEADTGFAELPDGVRSKLVTTVGGATRSESVAQGVREVMKRSGDNTWALVHDAARPLLSARDLANLVSQITQSNADGGLLATPVNDTLKRCQSGVTVANNETPNVQDFRQSVQQTVDRENLWQAQTPQMFRAKALLDALQDAGAAGVSITDEASAMEHAGMSPQIVQAMDPNFKITQSVDLKLATAWLLSIDSTQK